MMGLDTPGEKTTMGETREGARYPWGKITLSETRKGGRYPWGRNRRWGKARTEAGSPAEGNNMDEICKGADCPGKRT